MERQYSRRGFLDISRRALAVVAVGGLSAIAACAPKVPPETRPEAPADYEAEYQKAIRHGTVPIGIEKVMDGVYHLKFANQDDITSTLIRFQERYESPGFQNKVFTLREFVKWYIDNSKSGKETGEFGYYTDWNGFNFDSSILNPFYNGEFDPLTEREQQVLRKLRPAYEEHRGKGTLFYVIGTHSDRPAEQHEIAHALWKVNSEYHQQAQVILQDLDSADRQAIHAFFDESGGYNESVWEDETHLLASLDSLREKTNVDMERIMSIHQRLNDLFDKYRPKNYETSSEGMRFGKAA